MNRKAHVVRMTLGSLFVTIIAMHGGGGSDAGAVSDGDHRAAAGAQDFNLTWHTVDGGGGTSEGSGFELTGTAGQPDAGDLTGGDFALSGGFWQPAAAGDPGCGDCPTDVDGNGLTEAFDLANLLGAWGPCAPGAPCECLDSDGDGSINAFDLAVLLGAWGPCP